MDIFELLTQQIGCTYISDLRFEPYLSKARLCISEYDLTDCSLVALKDLAAYLYGEYRTVSKEGILNLLRGNPEQLWCTAICA